MSDFRDVDAVPLAWREAGSGPLVLFLHGLGMTRTGFDPQLAELRDSYRCVAWDMPGYGASPPAPSELSFPLLADAVAGLIDALGESSAHLAGLSLGGQIALHAALRHPDRLRSLVLLDSSPAFGLDGTDAEVWKRRRLHLLDSGETPASMAEPVLRSVMAPGVDDRAVAAIAASMARISAAGLRAAIDCLPSHDVRARLGEIAAPTLVLVGERDTETPLSYAEMLVAGIPGAELRVIPGAGHISSAEAPEAVNAALRAHLDAVEAAG
jgi:3-oxoadipate enol-lactonase